MMTDPVLIQMDEQIASWDASNDPRRVFLQCYRAMTDNMIRAVDGREFHDGPWVDKLLRRFAEYYFTALSAYNRDPSATPTVWRVAFDHTRQDAAMTLQRLLMGVNAHINYDLVLTLVDVLEDDWPTLNDGERSSRYTDHSHVNEVIARTIDLVQDDILEKETPSLDLIDKGLGRLDEFLISKLISSWRDQVWQQAIVMLEADADRSAIHEEVALRATKRATALAQPRWYLHPTLLR